MISKFGKYGYYERPGTTDCIVDKEQGDKEANIIDVIHNLTHLEIDFPPTEEL
ncbi:hypothetical protein KTO58_06795 [Chitinophaga pendula]|uniref:hypothetical protein n=1 Tax=Chitinophaga TaxID=79328 RepID=UPI0012FD7915|nr:MULTISPECIES: hypothetical protein [Chitinophaga]UCJ08887.1 hypothetical protein KTO58_06795 [Chitinophaga pendula]